MHKQSYLHPSPHENLQTSSYHTTPTRTVHEICILIEFTTTILSVRQMLRIYKTVRWTEAKMVQKERLHPSIHSASCHITRNATSFKYRLTRYWRSSLSRVSSLADSIYVRDALLLNPIKSESKEYSCNVLQIVQNDTSLSLDVSRVKFLENNAENPVMSDRLCTNLRIMDGCSKDSKVLTI